MIRKIYRRNEVLELFGISNAWLYEKIAAGHFPKADVKLGPQTVGWTEEILEAHRAELIAAAQSGQ